MKIFMVLAQKGIIPGSNRLTKHYVLFHRPKQKRLKPRIATWKPWSPIKSNHWTDTLTNLSPSFIQFTQRRIAPLSYAAAPFSISPPFPLAFSFDFSLSAFSYSILFPSILNGIQDKDVIWASARVKFPQIFWYFSDAHLRLSLAY